MFDIPEIEITAPFVRLTPLMEARGIRDDQPVSCRPPGEELDALREAVPDFRAAVIESGFPTGVTTCDLVTFPYPTRFGLWRATISPSPFAWMTNRMSVIQWEDDDGETRTLLWEVSDYDLSENTPYFARLKKSTPIPDRLLRTNHGSVLGHLRALGIDPGDIDYLAFDHLHTQDVRRLVGTTRPAPELDGAGEPLEPWFPNAKLIVQAREWETIRHLHPLQAPWYQPETYRDLPHERIILIDGDVLLGPGVALMATPGHTAGNMSLVVRTEDGLWTSSENGIAAECYAPHHSKLPRLRGWARDWEQDVILNANTLEFTAWQYNSMIVESLVADPIRDGRFPQCFPTSELTAHPLSPGTKPTYTHGGIEHGVVRGSDVLRTPLATAAAS